MTRLIISEKNIAAQRIASILSRRNFKKTFIDRIPVFRFTSNGKEHAVVGLRGHILGLDYPKEFQRWDVSRLEDLVRTTPIKKPTVAGIAYALRQLAKEADLIIIATDFDREGELIGAEAIEVMGTSKIPIKRAKFSALTNSEVNNAFDNLVELDINLANAAEIRQVIDLAWGASLTRFVSVTSGQTGKDFLSVGRVQSPTLALVVDKEKEILNFVSKPFWEISVDLEKDRHFLANHSHGVFWEKSEADKVLKVVKDAKEAKVLNVKAEEKMEYPPNPFNTTQFLSEADRQGISASRAMRIAESLYTDGWISYPRTDNTVYPKSLPLIQILKELIKSDLGTEAKEILAQDKIRASRGKKETTDHPPIHPVAGATRKQLHGDDWTIYELVVRRFLATLAPSATVLSTKAELDVKSETFIALGHKVLDRGWYKYYPYFKPKETFIPELEKGEIVKVDKVKAREGKTSPPKKYTQGALIREMEKIGLGTKSTRHEIIQKLYDRKYIDGAQVTPTTTGMALIEALKESAEQITRADMTRILEEDMGQVAEGKKNMDEVISESREMLLETLKTLKENKDNVRKNIREALKSQSVLGECPKCGSDLLVRWSRNNKRFVGCSGYPKCTNTYPLPQTGFISAHDEKCEVCKTPTIMLAQKKRKPRAVCLDMDCQTKKRK